jgi:hypothetical protein
MELSAGLTWSPHVTRQNAGPTRPTTTMPTYLTIPDVTADADTAATISKIDPKAVIDDMFSQPYVSFDWTKEDDDAPATCPSLVSAGVPSSISKSIKAPLEPKFAQGRFMETIHEESEEEVEEEMMMMMDQDAEVDCESQISTEIATPPPSVFDSDRDERYSNLRNPTFQEIDELLDIPSDKRIVTMKTLGIYEGFMRRTVVIKLPDPNAKLRRISRKRDNLDVLAWVASTQEYAPFTNLDLLASCC